MFRGKFDNLKEEKIVLKFLFFLCRWGYTSVSGTNPEILQWIKVKTIELDECRDKMSRQNAARVFETNICAVSLENSGGGMATFI